MPDRVGQSLGNYRLVRLLGRGGFAEVYLGEHQRLGSQAAIKILYAHAHGADEDEFLAEARTIARLVHPHIVRILDFDVQDGTPFLVMDYASNGNLRQRHPKGTRLPLATVSEYIKQIADALQYAHDEKVIHRDIKPENMLVGRRSEIFLSDFGIALIAQSSRLQSTQEVVGTAMYMAPEQLQGKPRLASDQYALGIVIYEWLTGDRPFHGGFVELYSQHLSVPPPPLRSKVPDLSPDLERVVLTALAKDPAQRFGSIKAFANAFEQATQKPAPSPTITPQISNDMPIVTVRNNTPPAPAPVARHDAPDSPVPAAPIAQPGTPASNPPTPIIDVSNQANPYATYQTPLTSPPSTTSFETPPQSHAVPPPQQDVSRTASRPVSKQGISRRGVIIGASVLVVVAAGGGGAWLLLSQQQAGTVLYIYKGHSDAVNSSAWSPNSKSIASGSLDNTVQVWNAGDGSAPFTYKGHSNTVNSVAWSPDGTRIASGSFDNTVQVWNASDGSAPFTYKGHSNTVNSVSWSPDGTRIASGSFDNTVQVWNASDGSAPFTYKGHSDSVASVVWSLDGKRIASGSNDNTVQVWNASDGTAPFTYKGHSGFVISVAWSPDGTRIASGSTDSTVQVWNAGDGSAPFTYTGHSGSVNSVAWSPDGKYIASGSSDHTVQVWSAP